MLTRLAAVNSKVFGHTMLGMNFGVLLDLAHRLEVGT